MIERHNFPVVTDAELPAFSAAHGDCVLFFAGDADRLMESDDVAVIFPELIKAARGALVPVIIARESERTLQRKYRFSSFPALVFLRRGEYLGAISRVRDWMDYMREIPQILSRTPSTPPPFKLPGVGEAEGASSHTHDGPNGYQTHTFE